MIEVIVKPDNGTAYPLTATARDVNKWEKRGKGRSLSQFESNMSLSAMYEIAHIAAVRQGVFDGTLSDFEDQVDLEFPDADEDADDEAGPTRRAR